MKNRRIRACLPLALGLALTMLVAIGTRVWAMDESGGFYCAYGMCSLNYYECGGASIEYTTNGNCVVTVTSAPNCYIEASCDPGSRYWWEVQGYIATSHRYNENDRPGR